MTTRRSSKRAPVQTPEGAAPRDPSLVTPEMIREAEDKIGRMDIFRLGADWALQKTVLETRAQSLDARMRGLLHRVGRAGTDTPPVTLDQIARLQGEIEQNAELLRFPDITLSRWQDQLREMREAFIRQREA